MKIDSQTKKSHKTLICCEGGGVCDNTHIYPLSHCFNLFSRSFLSLHRIIKIPLVILLGKLSSYYVITTDFTLTSNCVGIIEGVFSTNIYVKK